MTRILTLASCFALFCLSFASTSSGQGAPARVSQRLDILKGGPRNELLIHDKSREILMGASVGEVAMEEEAEEVEYELDGKQIERHILDLDIEDESTD